MYKWNRGPLGPLGRQGPPGPPGTFLIYVKVLEKKLIYFRLYDHLFTRVYFISSINTSIFTISIKYL